MHEIFNAQHAGKFPLYRNVKVFYKINVVNKTAETTSYSPRVQRKREAKREQILATAMKLLASGGIESVTVQGLAKELDYTAGALYRYFPGKDALLAAMQRHSVATLRKHYDMYNEARAAERVERGIDAQTSDLMALMSLADFYMSLSATLPHDTKLINFLLADPRNLISEEDAARVKPAFFGLLHDVATLFDQASASGALTAGVAPDRGVVFWSALQGTLQLEKLQRYDARIFQPNRLGRQLAKTLLLGWGADPQRLERALTELDKE